MIRIAFLFLIVMALIGFLGKLRKPTIGRRKPGKGIEPAKKCPRCGTYLIGDASCDCSTDSRPS